MKRFIVKHKRGMIAWILIVTLLAAGYMIFIHKTHINFNQPLLEAQVDNQLRNISTFNEFITSVDGKLYLTYPNHPFKTGIYEISSPFVRCVNWSGFLQWSVPEIGYVYDNKPLDIHLVKNDDDTVEIKELLSDRSVVRVKNTEADIARYFTLENKLYFESWDGKTVYLYQDGKLDTVVSEDLCGENLVPCQYYRGQLFFYNDASKNSFADDNSLPQKLYRYDLNNKTIVGEIDLSGMKDVLEQYKTASCDYLICDNCIYYEFLGDESEYYRYDWTSQKAVKLFETQGLTSFNAYGDTAYVAVTGSRISDGEKGLYALTSVADHSQKLYSGSFKGVSILDDKTVYLQSENNHIYRITKDGKDYQKVF